jgi:cytochrome c-type biogenesis protein
MNAGSLWTLYGAGLLTFASPCVLPMLPVYVSILGGAGASGSGDEVASRRRLRLAGLGFALGLALVFVALGAGASALASSLAAHRRLVAIVSGALMVLFGAKLAGVLRVPFLDREARPLLGRIPSAGGFSGGLLFGAAFAIGWTPCVGPVLGAALTYAASSGSGVLGGAVQLAAYAAGLATPLVAAAFAAPAAVALSRRILPTTVIFQRASGVLLVGVGLLLATGRLAAITPAQTAVASCGSGPEAACTAPEGETAAEALDVPVGRPLVLEFVSGHCAVCARMAPIVDELAALCAKDAGVVVRVQVDDPRGQALAARYGVRFVPTFLAVDASAAEVERVVGEQPRERLASLLTDVRGEACPATL